MCLLPLWLRSGPRCWEWNEELDLVWTLRYRDQTGRAPPCGMGSRSSVSYVTGESAAMQISVPQLAAAESTSKAEAFAGTHTD